MADYGLRRPHWPGPYHPSWPPETGSWVMWVMPNFVKQGQVVTASRTSLVVQFQAHPTPTVIPDAYQYWEYGSHASAAKEYVLAPCDEPRAILGAPDGPTCSVRQAAAILGISSKDVRRMLRSSQIEGRQEGGRWAEVAVDSLSKAAPSPDDTD